MSLKFRISLLSPIARMCTREDTSAPVELAHQACAWNDRDTVEDPGHGSYHQTQMGLNWVAFVACSRACGNMRRHARLGTGRTSVALHCTPHDWMLYGAVGIEAESDRVEKLLEEIGSRDITEVLAEGLSKLAAVPSGGGGGVVAAAPAAGGGGGGAAAAPEKKEEKKKVGPLEDTTVGGR